MTADKILKIPVCGRKEKISLDKLDLSNFYIPSF